MREVGAKTNVDDGPARTRARDGWAISADQYFLQAFKLQDSDPTAAVQALRQCLEGWAHAACVELDPGFWDVVGSGQRPSLEDVLRRLGKHVDARFLQPARALQQRGNYFSHNQGTFKPATPREAGAALFDAAHLLEQLHRDVLRARPSPEVEYALAQVERPSRPSRALSSTAAFVPAPTPSAATPIRRPPIALFVALGVVAIGALVTVLVIATRKTPVSAAKAEPTSPPQDAPSVTHSQARPPEATRVDQARIRLGGYLTALRAGNVATIVEFHATPTQRLFLLTNADADRLTWAYGKDGNPPAPPADALDRCTVVSESPIAFLCPTEPKQQCFVFDDNLKLTARYDYQGRYGQPSTCPP